MAGLSRREVGAYSFLVVLALAMRLWGLEDRAVAHDEVLHLWYSWRLFQGEGYAHSPMMHGPFQFHATAASLWLFGDSLFAGRLLPALFGTGLVALPLLLRPWLGRGGALLAAAFLAFSPFLLYYSRYARNDVYMAVWALALVGFTWRYLDGGGRRYLYLVAGVLALALATKETAYLLIAILAAYLFLRSAPELSAWAGRGLWAASWRVQGLLRTLRARRGTGASNLQTFRPSNLPPVSRAGALFLLIVTLTLPQWPALVGTVQAVLPVDLVQMQEQGLPADVVGLPVGVGWWVGGAVAGAFVAVSVIAGVRWNWRVWLGCAAVFYLIWGLLYSTFGTNPLGLGTGMWQGLGYWVAQQGVERGSQPWYYYMVVLPAYEAPLFLLLFVAAGVYVWRAGRGARRWGGGLAGGAAAGLLLGYAAGGAVAAAAGYAAVAVLVAAVAVPVVLGRDADRFPAFLVFWTVVTFLAYTVAGEKMPWLAVNVVVPMALLAARFLRDVVRELGGRLAVPAGWALPGASVALVGLLLVALSGAGGRGVAWLAALGVLAVAAATGWLVGRVGVRHGLALLLLGVVLALSAYGVRAAVGAAYFEDEAGEEFLVYAHGTPGVLDAARRIERLGGPSGEGSELDIAIDNGDFWNWTWYLRNYPNASYPCMEEDCPVADDADVVVVDQKNRDRVAAELDGFGQPEELVKLWWPPEVYRDVTLGDLWRGLLDSRQRREVIEFLLYREVEPEPYLDTRMYMFVRGEPR